MPHANRKLGRQKTLKGLVRTLDRVFSEFIRTRDTNRDGYGLCCTCGRTIHYSEGDAGHYVKRQHFATRWDPRNVHLQCRKDNRFAGGKQDDYAIFLRRRYGETILEELDSSKREAKKYTRADLEALIENYRENIEGLEAVRS